MALITTPTIRLAKIEWSLGRPAQINTSAMLGERTIATTPWHGKWRAKVELAEMSSEAEFAPYRSFLVRCCGPIHTFQLPATVEAQNGNSGVTVGSTAAVGAVSMSLSGAATAMLEGQMVTVGGQLLQITAVSGSTITFEPPLRAQASAGAAVETANPYATVHLSASQIGWSIAPWRRFSSSFSVEEAI